MNAIQHQMGDTSHHGHRLLERLHVETDVALNRIYKYHPPTPLHLESTPEGVPILLKREDLSGIHSFKWRGACNRVAAISERSKRPAVLTVSAGNHAQGVALAAARLNIPATVVMPESTERVKVNAVRRLLGSQSTIVLHGRTYHDASEHAIDLAQSSRADFVHPFDDLSVIAGQATIAVELLPYLEHGTTVYVPIGGGGLAAGVSALIKRYRPDVRVVGVEAEGQACMHAAQDAGRPVRLHAVDPFCDGTAVRMVGDLPYAICSQTLDALCQVTHTQVLEAVRYCWNATRSIPEPSGALALAALLCDRHIPGASRRVAIISGANIDFQRLKFYL